MQKERTVQTTIPAAYTMPQLCFRCPLTEGTGSNQCRTFLAISLGGSKELVAGCCWCSSFCLPCEVRFCAGVCSRDIRQPAPNPCQRNGRQGEKIQQDSLIESEEDTDKACAPNRARSPEHTPQQTRVDSNCTSPRPAKRTKLFA